jgi:hypothetical protein
MSERPDEGLLTDKDIEERWKKRPGYMSDLRRRGLGPVFTRLGPRCIRYRAEDVRRYEDAQLGAPATSDFRAPANLPANVEPLPIRGKIVAGSQSEHGQGKKI